jgi:hypothetical protein
MDGAEGCFKSKGTQCGRKKNLSEYDPGAKLLKYHRRGYKVL